MQKLNTSSPWFAQYIQYGNRVYFSCHKTMQKKDCLYANCKKNYTKYNY